MRKFKPVDMPKHVRRAIATDDLEQLRSSGRKGAEVTNEIKAQKRAEREYYDEKHQTEERKRTEEANEHVVPIDPDNTPGGLDA